MMTTSNTPMITASKSALKDQQKPTQNSDNTDTMSDISIGFKKPKLGTGNLGDIEINRLSQRNTPEACTPNPITPLPQRKSSDS